MGEWSKIEWTDHTVNLWWGCAKVHAGCKNCYAEHLSDVRYKNDLWGENQPRKRIKSAFKTLEKLQTEAAAKGVMYRVFIGSMMDIFEDSKPLTNSHTIVSIDLGLSEDVSWEAPEEIRFFNHNLLMNTPNTGSLRQLLFEAIKCGHCPNLEFQFLTKRPWNVNKFIPEEWLTDPPANVLFGFSVSNQETFNDTIIQIAAIKGRKFLSVEPQLELIRPFEVGGWHHHVDWVIVGGESGQNRRPFDLEWAYAWQRECSLYRVPFFFKQIDKVRDKTEKLPELLLNRQFPTR